MLGNVYIWRREEAVIRSHNGRRTAGDSCGEAPGHLSALVRVEACRHWAGFILPFDSDAAPEYAAIASARRSAGRRVAPADCQIAASARSRGMAVATRNVRDFEGIEIELIDPWTAA